MGESAKAREMFEKAAGNKRHNSYLAYYQALALRKLGREAEAKAVLEALKKTGEDQLDREQKVDFFEKFGSRDDDQRQRANAHFLVALAKLGLEQDPEADLAAALKLNPNHLAARMMNQREMRI